MRTINYNAPAVHNAKILIQATPGKVWSVLSDIDNWTRWQKNIQYSQLNGPLRPGTSFVWKNGGSKISSTLHTVEQGKYLGWTGKALGTFAIHNWTLTEVDGNTEARVDESVEGVLPRLFKNSFRKILARGIQISLIQLKRESEKMDTAMIKNICRRISN